MSYSALRMGAVIELEAAGWLLRQGYEVFMNVGFQGPADLIAWKSGDAPIFVDVKHRDSGNFAGVMAHESDTGFQVRLLYHDDIAGFRWSRYVPDTCPTCGAS
jgi:hypothetical protein